MKLIKRDLKKLKNELLLELEDTVLDIVMAQMSNDTKDPKAMEAVSSEAIKSIMEVVKANSIRFAQICYTDESGNELEEEDLAGIPLKIMLFKECMPDVLEIVMGSMEEEEAKPAAGKRKRVVVAKK